MCPQIMGLVSPGVCQVLDLKLIDRHICHVLQACCDPLVGGRPPGSWSCAPRVLLEAPLAALKGTFLT